MIASARDLQRRLRQRRLGEGPDDDIDPFVTLESPEVREHRRRRPSAGRGRSPASVGATLRVVLVGAQQPGVGGQVAQEHLGTVGGDDPPGVDAEVAGHRGPQCGHPALGQAGDGEHQVDERLALGWAAEDVQAAADLGVLERAEVAVDVQHHVVELVVVEPPEARVAEVEVVEAVELVVERAEGEVVLAEQRAVLVAVSIAR